MNNSNMIKNMMQRLLYLMSKPSDKKPGGRERRV